MLRLVSRLLALKTCCVLFTASLATCSSLLMNRNTIAQAQPTAVTSLGNIFETDLAELKPTEALKSLAERARQERPECVDGLTFKIFVSGADPIFMDTLAKAREGTIEAYLDKNYGLKKNRDYAFANYNKAPRDDVQATYLGPEAINLVTKSTPAKGTKVRAGDTITVTMTATDNANSGQRGLKSITLIDLQKNGIVPDAWYAETAGVSKCTGDARKPPVVVARYIVPADPPPVIRLDAVAEDFAGNVERDLGEFPTGDWHGTMRLKREIPAEGYEHTINWTFAVSEIPGSDEVRGRAVVTIDYSKGSKHEECTFSHNIAPTRAELNVTGRRIGDRLMIDFPDPAVKYTVRQTCIRGLDESEDRPFSDLEHASFDISGIAPGAKYPLRFEAPPSSQQNRVTTTMELHRAKPSR